jgi:serine/threonine protein kinase
MAASVADIKSIFGKALELRSAAERAAYLEQACQGDSRLRAEVESLLQARQEAGGFLAGPESVPVATLDEPIGESPGTVIGPYKLQERIGEGGFGVVFLAEQKQPVRRRVALKVLKPGMDTRQVVARFEAERQALAIMDHPNIAKVFDGGATASGRPYFVMELVRGVPITEFCDQNHLTLRQRLELFVAVCQAVQHAHQKGIIHRDLKPSNVLVTLHDTTPVVKVIDFGVAKALGQELTDKTLFTGFAQMIGTPLYMSPEQAALSGLDVDTRSDVYSLGVLLYELLTGTTPFDQERLRAVGYDEMRRIIREEEPARPSTRLSTLGQAANTASANRGTDPRRLSRLCRGELDWIVMKALEKDRNRRYETASALATDVLRYLNDEPVQACSPSAWYRFRKLARRNKAALMTTSVLALAALVAMTALLVSYERVRREVTEKERALDQTRREKDRANRNVARAQKAIDSYLLTTASDARLRSADLSDLRSALLTSALSILQEIIEQEGEDRDTRATIAWAHGKLGLVYGESGQTDKAVAHYERARALWAGLATEVPATAFYRSQLSSCHNNLGLLQLNLGRLDQAEAAFRECLVIGGQLNADFPGTPEHRSSLAGALHNLAIVERQRGNREGQQRLLEQAIGHQEAAVAGAPSNAEYRQFLANHHNNLSVLLRERSKLPDSAAAVKEAIALFEGLVADFPREPEYRAALAGCHVNRGILLGRLGKANEAEKAYAAALTIEERLAADYPSMPDYRDRLAGTHHNLGEELVRLGKPAAAEKSYRQAIAILDRLVADYASVPQYRHRLAMGHHYLGELLLGQLSKPAEGEAAFRDALRLREALAREHPDVFDYAFFLGISQIRVGVRDLSDGQLDDARRHLTDAVGTLEPLFARAGERTELRWHLRSAHGARAEALVRLDRHAEALADWDRAIELDDGKGLPYFRAQRALTLAHLQKLTEAVAEAEALSGITDLPLYLRYDTAGVYAVASAAARGDVTAAERYAARAVELLREVHQKGYEAMADIKKDKNLDPLRSRADFQKLLAEVEAKRGP